MADPIDASMPEWVADRYERYTNGSMTDPIDNRSNQRQVRSICERVDDRPDRYPKEPMTDPIDHRPDK